MNAPERNLHLKAPASGELARIVRVNEEIKAIVATAFRINLMALNAIFLAKRAGNAALGFGVLSNELRRFAQDLTRHMSSLRDMTSGSVGSVTGVVQQQRNSAILAEAIRQSGDGVPGVREARKRGAARLAEQPEFEGKTIVVILPSAAERYLSSALFAGVFSEQELQQ